MKHANLLCSIPPNLPEELVQTLLSSPDIRIERIVSRGHQSAPGFWYDQDQNEWVLLVQGEARLQFEDQTLCLKAGDYVNIAGHQKHRVDWTAPDRDTIWLAIFY
ncbi:MAG: cupin domain-containing protein [Rhodoferax sp.]